MRSVMAWRAATSASSASVGIWPLLLFAEHTTAGLLDRENASTARGRREETIAGNIVFQPPIVHGAVREPGESHLGDIFGRSDGRRYRQTLFGQQRAQRGRVSHVHDQRQDVDPTMAKLSPKPFSETQGEGLASRIGGHEGRPSIAGTRID